MKVKLEKTTLTKDFLTKAVKKLPRKKDICQLKVDTQLFVINIFLFSALNYAVQVELKKHKKFEINYYHYPIPHGMCLGRPLQQSVTALHSNSCLMELVFPHLS